MRPAWEAYGDTNARRAAGVTPDATRTAVPAGHIRNPGFATRLPVPSALRSPDPGKPSWPVPLPLNKGR